MKILYTQIGQYRKEVGLTILLAMVQVIGGLLIPFIAASVIDGALESKNTTLVYQYGGLMVILAIISMTAGFFASKMAANSATGFAANLRDSIYSHIQDFSFSNIDKYSSSGLVTRLTTDVTNIQQAFQMTLLIASKAPLMIVFSMILSFIINPNISLIFVGIIIILAVFLFIISFFAVKIFAKVFARYDRLNENIQENVSGIRVVKAFVREDFENEKFKKNASKLYKTALKAESLLAFNNPLLMVTIYTCIILVSWLGANYIVQGIMTTGELSSLISYVMSIMMSLMMLSMVFTMIAMSLSNFKRIIEILNEAPSIAEPKNPVMKVKDGSIVFKHVNFSYSGDAELKTLKDITLSIHTGETIGVIGPSGSGKSSFISLINRLYDVDKDGGFVTVGGIDVRNYDLETLRREVAVVLQKNILFSGTILENLRWGNEFADKQECIEACKAASADTFIRTLHKGYETYLERGGVNLSGGQKQRICIARALLKKPKILVLDDSTSAVDTATDAKIRTSLTELMPNTTKIIIAQRIASVENADRIVVLEKGRISAFDSHEQLLKSNQFYRELNDLQKKAGGDFDLEK